MSYVKFGKIVASLRKEQFDLETGRPLSQKQLADAANLPSQAIGKIERGELVNLREDILTSLATALNLRAVERQEFWRAASPEGENNLNFSPEKALDHICEQCSPIKQPAFLLDPFYDLVAVNQPFLLLYGLKMRQLLENRSICNLLIFLFRADSPLRPMLGTHWHQIATMHLHFFRCISLRYRYTSYFDQILKQLRGLPDFLALWHSHEQKPDDLYSQIGSLHHADPVYGSLHYSMIITNTRTPTGPLHLAMFTPCNTEAFNCFMKLSMSGGPSSGRMERVIREWPHPELIA